MSLHVVGLLRIINALIEKLGGCSFHICTFFNVFAPDGQTAVFLAKQMFHNTFLGYGMYNVYCHAANGAEVCYDASEG